MRVAVLSAGSWGTSFAAVLADAGNDVILHGRRHEIVDASNTRHENPAYLPGIVLPKPLRATTDIAEASRPRPPGAARVARELGDGDHARPRLGSHTCAGGARQPADHRYASIPDVEADPVIRWAGRPGRTTRGRR